MPYPSRPGGNIGIGEFSTEANLLIARIKTSALDEPEGAEALNAHVMELFNLFDNPDFHVQEDEVQKLLAIVESVNLVVEKKAGGRRNTKRRHKAVRYGGDKEIRVTQASFKFWKKKEHAEEKVSESAREDTNKLRTELAPQKGTKGGEDEGKKSAGSELTPEIGCNDSEKASILKFLHKRVGFMGFVGKQGKQEIDDELGKIVKFAKEVGPEISGPYFLRLAAWAETDNSAAEALISDSVVANREMIEFLKVDASLAGRYFAVLGEYSYTVSPVSLGAFSSQDFFRRAEEVAATERGVFGRIPEDVASLYLFALAHAALPASSGKTLADAMAAPGAKDNVREDYRSYLHVIDDLSLVKPKLAAALMKDGAVKFIGTVTWETADAFIEAAKAEKDGRFVSDEFLGRGGALETLAAINGSNKLLTSYFGLLRERGDAKRFDALTDRGFLNALLGMDASAGGERGGSIASAYIDFLYDLAREQRWSTPETIKVLERALERSMGEGFRDFLSGMDGEAGYDLLKALSKGKSEGHFTEVLFNLIDKYPKELQRVSDRIGDLSAYYYGTGAVSGYSPAEEIEYLVRKGNKAKITQLAGSVRESYSNTEGHNVEPYATAILGYKRNGAPINSIIDMLDALAVLKHAYKLEPRARETLSQLSNTMSKVEPAAKPEDLEDKYPDVMAYLGRHLQYAADHKEYDSQVQRDRVIALLSVCHRYGRPANVPSVDTEKQQLARNVAVRFNPKYEKKFMDELSAAADRARFDAMVELLDLAPIALRMLVGDKADKGRITPELRNALLGYLNLGAPGAKGDRGESTSEKALLGKLIQTYYLEGQEAARKWVDSLDGNREIMKVMKRHGTRLEGLEGFKVTYQKTDMVSFDDEYRRRAAQEYVTAASILSRIGLGKLADFSVDEVGGASAKELVSSAKSMEGKIKSMAADSGLPEQQKQLLADARNHLGNVAGAAGQIYSASREGNVTFYSETDPIKKLMLGVGFPSCVNVVNGLYNYAAVSYALDDNAVVFYVRDEKSGAVIGRVSLVESDAGFVVSSGFYGNTKLNLFQKGRGWLDVLRDFARVSGRDVLLPKEVLAGGMYMPKSRGLAELVETEGLERQTFDVHVERAVGEDTYSDILSSHDGLGPSGYDYSFEGYRLEGK